MPVSPELTGGAGFTFEDAVVAWYLVALLTERPGRGLKDAVTRVSVQRGALGQPLDDLILEARTTSGVVGMALQVKRTFVFKANAANSDFFEVIERSHRTIQAPAFQVGFDRVGVATDSIDLAHARQVRTLCEWARDSADCADFLQRVATAGVASKVKREIVDAVRTALQQVLQRAPDDIEVFRLFQHFVLMRFELLGEGAADQDLVLDRIADGLADRSASAAQDVWRALRTIAREASGHAGSFERQGLMARLGGWRFAPAPSLKPDIDRLDIEARAALSTISRSIDGLVIPRRDLIEQVHRGLQAHRLVQIVGQPGTGKSALLRAFSESMGPDTPLLALKADRLPEGGWSGYRQRLGLETPDATGLLREMAANGEPILLIDALDRVSRAHRAIVSELVGKLVEDATLHGWKIVATLRDGGGKSIERWLPQIRGLAAHRIDVGSLSDDEAGLVSSEKPRLRPLLFGPPAVREIARRPFFLNVLASAIELESMAPSSETELLDAWWTGGGYDAEGAETGHRQDALLQLARGAAGSLGRGARIRGLNHEAVESLRADGIIRDEEPGHTVSFSHDIFFEWALAHGLIDAGELWLEEVVRAGEAPALGRPVELLSQMRFERDQNWAGQLLQLAEADSRTQWRRSWLVAPFSSPLFDQHAGVFSSAVFGAEGDQTFSQLLSWFQALRTEPDDALASGASDLSEADRARLADSLAKPNDYAAWRRFLWWLLSEEGRLSAGRWPDVLSAIEVWQHAAASFPNDLSAECLVVVEQWLHKLEDHRHPTTERGSFEDFEDLSYDGERDLCGRLRTVLLRSGVAYPELVERYLERLISRKALAREAWSEVQSSAAWAARASAGALADLTLKVSKQTLPRARLEKSRRDEEKRREQAEKYPEGSRERMLMTPLGVGGWIDFWDWDHLALEGASNGFFPPTPETEPFASLFRESPEQALRLVKGLANHAVDAWLELHELDFERRRKPIPLELAFPWGRQTFWGSAREYFAYRAVFAPQVLEAGLMVLEDWAFAEFEAGRDLDDVIRQVTEGCRHNAVLGIATALALTKPQGTAATFTLVTCQRLWRWDLERLVKIDRDPPANEMGAMGRARHLIPLRRSNQRPARKRWIRNITLLFALSADPQVRGDFQAALHAFPDDPALDFEDEAEDEELLAERKRSALRAVALAEADSYAFQATPEGVLISEKPRPPADAVEQSQAEEHREVNRWMALAMWGTHVLEANPSVSSLSNEAAIDEARALDEPDLFLQSPGVVDLSETRRTGVAAAAAFVLRSDSYQDAELLDWAEDVIVRACQTELRGDGWLFPESALPFHPLKYVGIGLTGMIRRGRRPDEATAALLQFVACWVREISVASARAVYEISDARPALADATIQLVAALSVRPDTPLQHFKSKDEAYARRNAHIEAALDQALDVATGEREAQPIELSHLSDGADEGDGLVDEVWLDTEFLARHLEPLAEAKLPPALGERLFDFGETLLKWSIVRTEAGGRRRRGENLIQWRAALMSFLADRVIEMPTDEVVDRVLSPISALEDEPCFKFLGSFVARLTATSVLDAVEVRDTTLELLVVVARRVAEMQRGWRDSYDADSRSLIGETMCVPTHRANLARRFANGDWSSVGIVLPIVDILFAKLAGREVFVRAWLELVELSHEFYPVERFAAEIRQVLEARPRSGWGGGLTGRIAALIQLYVENQSALDVSVRDDFLRALDHLVDDGDRRAAALQRSEAFRSVRRAD